MPFSMKHPIHASVLLTLCLLFPQQSDAQECGCPDFATRPVVNLTDNGGQGWGPGH